MTLAKGPCWKTVGNLLEQPPQALVGLSLTRREPMEHPDDGEQRCRGKPVAALTAAHDSETLVSASGWRLSSKRLAVGR